MNTHQLVTSSIAAVLTVIFSIALPAHAVTFGTPEAVQAYVDAVPAPIVRVVTPSNAKEIQLMWGRSIAEIDEVRTSYFTVVKNKLTGEVVFTGETVASFVSVTGLDANTGYVATVVARRNGFISEPATIVARTRPNIPASTKVITREEDRTRDVITNQPIGWGGVGAGAYVAHISWKKPAGKIRYFTVDVYDATGTTFIQTVKTKRPRVLVTGLQKEVYTYQVTAHFNSTYSSLPTALKTFEVEK